MRNPIAGKQYGGNGAAFAAGASHVHGTSKLPVERLTRANREDKGDMSLRTAQAKRSIRGRGTIGVAVLVMALFLSTALPALASKIAVVEYHEGETTTGKISLMDDSTGIVTHVITVSEPKNAPLFSVALSPDERKIAYGDPSTNILHVVNSDGTGDHVVSRNFAPPFPAGPPPPHLGESLSPGVEVDDQKLAWAPDNHTIVYPGELQQLPKTSPKWGLKKIKEDGTGDTQLISGEPGWRPSVSSDGTKVIYTAAFLQYKTGIPVEYVLVARMDGSGNETFGLLLNGKELNGTPVPPPPGVSTIGDGAIAPNGRVYFDVYHKNEGTIDIWSSGLDGSAPQQITHARAGEQFYAPSVSPDGSTVSYLQWEGSSPAIGVMNADGTNQRILAYRKTATGGWLGGVPVYAPGKASDELLAREFMPILRFDSHEQYRPLNVERFLTETYEGLPGEIPWNKVCDRGISGSCHGLAGEASLRQYLPNPSEPKSEHWPYIEINHEKGVYQSPYSECHLEKTYPAYNELGPIKVKTKLLDCDTGPQTAIYYQVVGPSPYSGYKYINYGFFYRNDQGEAEIASHAGDWEGMTIAPSGEGTFAFAQFSQHGEWYSYLRGNLECDEQGEKGGTCGNEVTGYSGLHVMSFPARGTHANYPEREFIPHNNPDGPHDGAALWGANRQETALLPFPPTQPPRQEWSSLSGRWTDWPGHWGESEPNGPLCFTGLCAWSPTSPAAREPNDHGPHFFAPWTAKSGECEAATVEPRACPSRRRVEPPGCRDWFGADVAALACDQRTMRSALRHRRLEHSGRFSLDLVDQRRISATAPGLAQALGRPLRPGERAVFRGAVPAGAEILIRASCGRRRAVFAFEHLRSLPQRAAVVVRRGPDCHPQAFLYGGRTLVRPTWSLGSTFPPSPRDRS
jgi:hypothetical protein